jgi:hypothetical protein
MAQGPDGPRSLGFWPLISDDGQVDMKRSTWFTTAILACGLMCDLAPFIRAEEHQPGRYALLVGVTRYPALAGLDLQGPANDVLLMEDLLQSKFGFSCENIVSLSEIAARKDPARLPTRAHIEREFGRLARVVSAGDQVVIFLSGHGSQQPEVDRPANPERDGLDEIFLPRDVQKWKGEGPKGAVPGAIRDDEIGAWVKAIQARKASVWLIVDACHSGTMLRGVGEVVRQVPTGVGGLAIPAQVLDKARRRAADRVATSSEKLRGGRAEQSPLQLDNLNGVVALYACQPEEVTVERDFPPSGTPSRCYGLLTYTLNEVLTRAGTPMTYRELTQRLQTEYVHLRRVWPTPLLEGPDLDREVLGTTTWPGRSRILLGEGGTINAGSMHGLTAGSILAVRPPAGEGDQVLGYVQIQTVGPLEAEVKSVAHADKPVTRHLPVGGRCQVVLLDLGEHRLGVALDTIDVAGKPISQAQRQHLEGLLAKVPGPGIPVEVIGDVRKADWVLRPGKDRLHLVRASDANPGSDLASVPLYESIPVDDDLVGRLREHLGRILRAENLMRIASDSAADLPRQSNLRLDIEVRLRENKYDRSGKRPLVWQGQGLTLFDQDLCAFVVRNPARVSLDVTLLYVDSDYGITTLFPSKKLGEDNRLRPGESVTIRTNVNAKTVGLEHLVVVGVRGKGQRVDLSSLDQPSLEKARKDEKTRGVQEGLDSPLGKLLRQALYSEGDIARTMTREDLEDYTIRLLSWRVEPRRRPASEGGD